MLSVAKAKKNGRSGDCSLADRMDRVYEKFTFALAILLKIRCQPRYRIAPRLPARKPGRNG